ncbi:hypothetical protein MycrhDRAFT_4938 [Mycolicibacterium rhodesiae JS60]|nr:hypothetical protein MycrhDRAFT_4938 [Mycolicibacterium rhodesiae JS60]
MNANGTLSYSITKANVSYYHEAARIGASGTAVADWFNVTVTDGFGGTSTVKVTVPVWAVDSAPAISGYGSPTCAFYLCTRGSMTVDDTDGDSIPNNATTPGTGAGYSLATGSVTVWGSGVTTISWAAGGTFGTTATANTFTVYDGYYTVTNGVANIGTPAKFWVQWAANSGNTTTGN